MRHSKFLVLASIGLVAALPACSTEEDDPVPAAADNAIRFTAASRLPQGRATSDITTASLDQFFVYGYLASDKSAYMTDVEVNKTGSGLWEYSPVKYWPSGDALNFYAYAPQGMLPQGTTPLDAVHFDNSGTSDFIYAVEPGMTQPAKGSDAQVKFNFRHALARITVMLSSEDSKLEVRVNNATIVGANRTGDFSFPAASTAGEASAESVGTWSNLADKSFNVLFMAQRQSEIITLTPEPVDVDIEGDAAKYFIPQELPFVQGGDYEKEVYLALTCAMYDKATGKKVWPNANTPDINLPNGGLSGEGYIYLSLQGTGFTAWQSGYHYVYNVVINGHPDMSQIEFGNPTVDTFVTVTTQLQP
ncbi:MAG: fimbrillin family protein [Muribaculaceae bacterium]|nr:fimbrillin family protein [Muribaculaceae bacterium]MDE6197126.1 fimbrillin family protein [Muribaculaceae bacterium]